MLRTVLNAMMLSAAAVGSSGAQQPRTAIDSLMSAYDSPRVPGASLLVVHDGKVELAKGYGLADVKSGTLVTRATNFRLASLSKQFTATAVMLLAAEGKLRYDDDITRHLTTLPAFAHGVTIRNLLNHTGGLPDYEDFVPDSQQAQVHDADVPRLISHAATAKFPPGTKYDYSNTGYALLALIVEHASGMRYADFLRKRIFVPLHMAGTVAYEAGRSSVSNRAYGHTLSGFEVKATDQSNTSAVLGDGGIYSSANDLALWDRAIAQHTLVGARDQTLASSAHAAERCRHGVRLRLVRGSRPRHASAPPSWGVPRVHERHRPLSGPAPDRRDPHQPDGRTAPWDIAQQIADLYLGRSGRQSAPWRP